VQGVRYAELAATTHAKNETQVWTGKIERSWRDSDLLTRLTAAAVANVHLLQYRGAAVRTLHRYRDGWIEPDDPETDDTYAVRGYQPMGATDTPIDRWEADLPNDGTCAGARCSVGFDALRRTIAAARAAGSAYVLVNVPEHAARWRTPDGAARYRDYISRLRSFAAAEGVDFVDPTDADPFRFEATPYADLSHMTAAGSRQFTRVLAERLGPIVTVTLRDAAGRRGRG
jgi:hypothetical protein